MIIHTFSEFISNNTHTFSELLPNKSKHIFRVHIKHYWHFEGVTRKQYYTLFQTSSNTDIFREFLSSKYYTLSLSLHQAILTFSELLANNTTHFSRAYIKQYWHFQRVSFKLNYSKKFFQSSYHTILTLSESYYQTILTYSEHTSNSIHTFIELLLSNSKHFFESLNEHLNRQKNKQKIPT